MMTNQMLIEAQKHTVTQVQQALASHGIRSQQMNSKQALRFGMRLSTETIVIEVSPEEIIQLAKATPQVVDAFFDTLDRFREHIKVFLNGKPAQIPKKHFSSSTKPITIDQFMRGESGFIR